MGKLRFNNPTPLWKSSGFYVALAVCLAALGISTATAMSRLRQLDARQSVPSSQAVSSYQQAQTPQSNVPYPDESAASTPTATDATVSDNSVLTQPAPFFTLPVTGSILKDFDSEKLQYSETYKDWRIHLGVDIAGEAGAPVLACGEGVVETIYEDPALGTIVAIDHGGGLTAFYCGLGAKPTVRKGQQVESGQQIGVIGTVPTECVEQSHLHLEMEQDGKPISPLHRMDMMD